MKKRATVTHRIDLSNPPVPDAAQQQRLQALAALPDADIDYSDIPDMSAANWRRAAALPAPKRQITLRIDSDVLDFFRDTGPRYQSRINAVLRAWVLAQKQGVGSGEGDR